MATRRERVVLDLEDNLTPGALRAAAAVGVLDKSLNGLNDRNVAVARSVQSAAPAIDRVGTSARGSAADIDSFSGRVSLLADALLMLGPAAIPIGAVAIPALTTLAGAGAAAAVGAGTMAIAFQGVGDALETMNEAHLEPTKENLEEARVAMERLAPAAQEFVKQIDSMRGLGAGIRDAGAQALFPGLTEALETIESRGPEVTRIVEAFNRELGDIASDAATSLASDRWDDFFRMVEREGPRTLDPLARAIGDVAHGASEIMEAFAPLNRDGMGWIESAADGFDRWATGLKKTEGFRDFVAYVRRTGPEVAETLGALATAAVDIAEAAAPMGGPALDAIEGMARALSAVADSGAADELLAIAVAMRAVSRAAPLFAGASALLGGGAVAGGAAGAAGAAGVGAAGAAGAAAGGGLLARLSAMMRSPAAKGGVVAGGVIGVDAVSDFTGLDAFLERNIGGSADSAREWVKRVVLKIDADTKIAENKLNWVNAEIRRLRGQKANAKVGLDDREARIKAREQDDWIMSWGRKNARAQANLDDRQAQARGRAVEAMLNGIDRKRAHPTADLNDQASGPLGRVSGLLSALDGRTANTTVTTTYVTRHVGGGGAESPGFGPMGGVADGGTVRGGRAYRYAAWGGTVPKTGLGYADRHPYLLADGEEVISNRHGQADRHRALLKAINAGRLASGGTAGRSVSPSVSVAGAQVRVFIGDQEVRAIVQQEQAAQSRWEREQARD